MRLLLLFFSVLRCCSDETQKSEGGDASIYVKNLKPAEMLLVAKLQLFVVRFPSYSRLLLFAKRFFDYLLIDFQTRQIQVTSSVCRNEMTLHNS